MAETRVALVSGANRGIGLEIVRHLGRLGTIAVIGARAAGLGRAAATALAAEGLITPVVALDVRDDASVRAAIAEVMGLFGQEIWIMQNAESVNCLMKVF